MHVFKKNSNILYIWYIYFLKSKLKSISINCKENTMKRKEKIQFNVCKIQKLVLCKQTYKLKYLEEKVQTLASDKKNQLFEFVDQKFHTNEKISKVQIEYFFFFLIYNLYSL